jgi:HNH endonuclease
VDERTTLLARLWAHVDKPAGPDACWEWQGSRTTLGYGRMSVRLSPGRWRSMQCHRLVWELTYGRIMPGIFVCHHCDNPPCVRPEHLFLGTPGDNHADMRRKHREPQPIGRHNGRAKLTEAEVCAIRQLRGQATQQQIAIAFGVSQILVSLILRGKIWTHVVCEDVSITPSVSLEPWPQRPVLGRYGSHVSLYKDVILTRRAAGETYESIANDLGFSTTVISKRYRRWMQEGR